MMISYQHFRWYRTKHKMHVRIPRIKNKSLRKLKLLGYIEGGVVMASSWKIATNISPREKVIKSDIKKQIRKWIRI